MEQPAPSNQKTILVLGGNGRVGRAAVDSFAAEGWRVMAQVRRSPTKPFQDGVEAVELPLSDADGISEQVSASGCPDGDPIWILYAINPSSYGNWTKEVMPLLHLGLDISEKIASSRGGREVTFMLPGNVYNYGKDMPLVLKEDTPMNPTTTKGRQRCEMENELKARTEKKRDDGEGALRVVVIRAGDFYGCGTGSWMDLAVVKDLKSGGKIVYPGPLDVIHPWAYLPDLAKAFVGVAELPSSEEDERFQTFHFPGHAVTGEELVSAIEKAATDLGLKPDRGFKKGGMPWGIIRVMGVVKSDFRELAIMSYLWKVPHELSGDKLEKSLDEPVPRTPLADAIRQTLLDLGMGKHS